MANEPLYGIIDRNLRWLFYGDGRMMAFSDIRLARAAQIQAESERPGAPFQVAEVGLDGLPVFETKMTEERPSGKKK